MNIVCKELLVTRNFSEFSIKLQIFENFCTLFRNINPFLHNFSIVFNFSLVRKFYETVHSFLSSVLPRKLKKHEETPTKDYIRKLWAKEMTGVKDPVDNKKKVNLTLPWQYMDFVSLFNGINFTEEDCSFYFMEDVGKYLYSTGMISYVSGIHNEEKGKN